MFILVNYLLLLPLLLLSHFSRVRLGARPPSLSRVPRLQPQQLFLFLFSYFFFFILPAEHLPAGHSISFLVLGE